MNVCRFGYKRSDGKCALNGNKCRTTCGSNVDVDVEPPTHKDVLLKTWAQDTDRMAHETIETFWNVCLERYEFPDGSYGLSDTDGLRAYIAYLNSAAEVGK